MEGEGLWTPSSLGDSSPAPLALAGRVLARALEELEGGPPAGVPAMQADGWQILRVEVPAMALGPPASLLMGWLAAQRGQTPRALFGARDASLLVAGVGSAHLHQLSTEHAPAPNGAASSDDSPPYRGSLRQAPQTGGCDTPLLPELGSSTSERIRYFGGTRFDACDVEAQPPSEEWGPFGRSYWILPRVELLIGGIHGQPGAPRPDAGTDQAVSSVNTPVVTENESGCPWARIGGSFRCEGWSIPVCLAVHLRWRPGGSREESWEADRGRAVRAVRNLRAPQCYAPLRGEVVRRSEAVSKDTFVECVEKALDAFKRKDLQKVVLARCAIMDLLADVDAVDVMHQVLAGTHKRHYLFLLEPAEGNAFVSLTPERLCKVHGPSILTEAVAGTWPIDEYERIGEAALLASSEKNSSEHQVVVDYICGLLKEITPLVNLFETHILKLRHLVHIKQSYHAMVQDSAGQVGSSPNAITTWFCKKMSPTPAVCGLPLDGSRRFINKAEPWDRGFYAAPCGFINSKGSELMVALRSALLCRSRSLRAYAGAGIVAGSSAEDEFAEISLKMRQFTAGFPDAPATISSVGQRLNALGGAPNMNTLWMAVAVEELTRCGVCNFVICAGSRSTPLVVAVSRHRLTRYVMNHDERGAAYYAVGWAKAVRQPVGIIVTSGTAVANLLPGVVEAAQSQVPLLVLTADRPAELRDTGSNQTITQPGIFGSYARWAKDMPCPSIEYPVHALLGDIDLAVAHASGALSQNPGPVHLNFQFRENLAPDAGAVRGAPGRMSAWPQSYIQTPELCRWIETLQPRSTYALPSSSLGECSAVEELIRIARGGRARIVVLAGTLRSSSEALIVEDIALRLQAALFADITSGLRQRPSAVNFADQLLVSPLLAGELMQLDAIVHIGGPCCSARLNAFAKSSAPHLYLRVAHAPTRMDQDHIVTHHLPCSLPALAAALVDGGLQRAKTPPSFWQSLSAAAGEALEACILNSGFTEPYIAYTVSRLMDTRSRLLISSSMPIRDLDFFAKPSDNPVSAPCEPPLANRGASGIDGVISTAAGFCRGSGEPATLVIGDTATLHDLNALQQLTGENAPSLTIVVINNNGGGIFSFLPIAQHKDTFSPCFDAPHVADFGAACQAFGLPYILCEDAEAFETAYEQTQLKGRIGALIIEARVSLSHTENVDLHRVLGQKVASRVRDALLARTYLGWTLHEPVHGFPAEASTPKAEVGGCAADLAVVLLHGWMGEQRDWNTVGRALTAAGHKVLTVDLLGHGSSTAGCGSITDAWEAAALFSMPMAVEALSDLLSQLRTCGRVFLVGYSLGGRVAMAFAAAHSAYCMGTLVLSANPGLRSVPDRIHRWKSDAALAARLRKLRHDELGTFLATWYAGSLFADLRSRRPEIYDGMIQRRMRTDPDLTAQSLLGLSVAKQQDYWICPGGGKPFWYAFGELDEKFAALGEGLREVLGSGDRVVAIAGAAHALVEECPLEVAGLVNKVVVQALGHMHEGGAALAPALSPPCYVSLAHVWSRPIEVPLKAPLMLSRGDPMHQRRGVLVILQTRDKVLKAEAGPAEDTMVTGIGEICPLPQFHRETLEEAERQLTKVLAAWQATPPTIPVTVAQLDGSLTQWLRDQCPDGDCLLPSVRCGLEMAILHLLCRATDQPLLGSVAASAHGLSCNAWVGVNSLIAREEELTALCSTGTSVIKIKVGKDPVDDARRVNRCAEAMLKACLSGGEVRLRLDANQAWTLDEAVAFVGNLSDCVVNITDYLEEPIACTDRAGFIESWEAFSERAGNRIRIAVDESLTETAVSIEQLENCRAPIAALILKPSLQGVEHTFELADWATKHGARPVISSAFESGVALSQYALLAGAMAASPSLSDSGVSAFHGLGTFTRLAEDVLQPPFADLISTLGGGWHAHILRCQAALDDTADMLAAAGRGECEHKE